MSLPFLISLGCVERLPVYYLDKHSFLSDSCLPCVNVHGIITKGFFLTFELVEETSDVIKPVAPFLSEFRFHEYCFR